MSQVNDLLAAHMFSCLVDAVGERSALLTFASGDSRRESRYMARIRRGQRAVDGALLRGLRAAPLGLVHR
jgi:hypothetical protein